MPLVGSSHPVRSEHIESVSCIPIVKWKYSCEVVASFSSSSKDRVGQNVGLGNPSVFFSPSYTRAPVTCSSGVPSLLGQVQTCGSSSPVTQNGHSVHIGGFVGSQFHSPNLQCKIRLPVPCQTPMPGRPAWPVYTPESSCMVVTEDVGFEGLPPIPVYNNLMSWPPDPCLSIASTQTAVQTITSTGRPHVSTNCSPPCAFIPACQFGRKGGKMEHVQPTY